MRRCWQEEEEEVVDSQPQWLKDVNANSLTVQSNALVEASVVSLAKYFLYALHWFGLILLQQGVHATNFGQAFQFMRVGYFVIDFDSTKSKVVLNRVVSLREANTK